MSTTQRPVSPATSAEWRRRREAAGTELPPAQDGERARNGLRIPAYTAGVPAQETVAGFAESQQAGLTAMLQIAEADSRLGPSSTAGPVTPVPGSPPVRAMDGSPGAPGAPAGSMPVGAAPAIVMHRLAVPVQPDAMHSARATTDLHEFFTLPTPRAYHLIPSEENATFFLTLPKTLPAIEPDDD